MQQHTGMTSFDTNGMESVVLQLVLKSAANRRFQTFAILTLIGICFSNPGTYQVKLRRARPTTSHVLASTASNLCL